MKRSLLAYEEYYREIHSKFEANINAIQQSFVAKMAAATNSFDKRLRKRESCFFFILFIINVIIIFN